MKHIKTYNNFENKNYIPMLSDQYGTIRYSKIESEIKNNNIDFIKKLLDGGIDVNILIDEYTMVHLATKYQSPEILQILIDNGANLDIKLEYQTYTALMLLSLHDFSNINKSKILYLLIDNDANWYIKNDEGDTFIDILEKRQSFDNIKNKLIINIIKSKYKDKYNDYLIYYSTQDFNI